MSKRTKTIIAVSVIVVMLAVTVAVGVLYQDTQSVPKPFGFSLSTYPNNGTIMSAQNLTITVDVAYLEGRAEPVTLSASGGPNGTIYQFSNQTGTPNATHPFSSNLTVLVPSTVATGSYAIEVLANSSTQVHRTAFNLTVVSAEIKVSGDVTINTKITVNGETLDVIPTDIIFTSTNTGERYEAKIHRYTDTTAAPGKTGNYSITLPNLQSYRVDFYCFSYPQYIPVPEKAKSGIENGVFTVNCGAGVTSMSANFTG